MVRRWVQKRKDRFYRCWNFRWHKMAFKKGWYKKYKSEDIQEWCAFMKKPKQRMEFLEWAEKKAKKEKLQECEGN